MYKSGETYTPEEVLTVKGNFKAMLFLIRADEYIYEQQLEYIRKTICLEKDEHPEMINGAYE